VAVGYVSDADSDVYPLVETYSDGSWAAAVAPSPPDAVARVYGSLVSVSCPADGVCAAVGDYDNGIQSGLLENLSDGVWSATTAPIPGDPDDGVANLSSVSCADPTSCTAVGEWGDGTTIGLIYSWSASQWQIEAVPPLPANYAGYITMTAISCADADDCTVVGRYANSIDFESGLILTMSNGIWSSMTAPEPANAVANEPAVLDSIDCPESNYCVAGGSYEIPPPPEAPGIPYPGLTYTGLLLVDQSGVWTTLQVPLPSDAELFLDSNVSGVYCSAAGACTATGTYNLAGWAPDIEEGMFLSEGADGSWSAATAPLPDTPVAAERKVYSHESRRRDVARDRGWTMATTSGSGSAINGVSCGSSGGLCVAAGTNDTSGLLETSQGAPEPTVIGVAPSSGPTSGGTEVTVTGSGFTADTNVLFGGVSASDVTFVNANEIDAVAPAVPSCPGNVDITVDTDGVVSRSSFSDLFTFEDPDLCPTVSSFSPAAGPVGSSVTISGLNLSGATQVAFDGTPAAIASTTATRVTVTVPLGQDAGLITVTTASGEVATATSFELEGFYVVPEALPVWDGSLYDGQLLATGGEAPYKWKVVSGKLPKGLKLSSSGELSGKSAKKATAGNYSFTVRASDSTKKHHNNAEGTYTIQVS
jgi:hypothetical protein